MLRVTLGNVGRRTGRFLADTGALWNLSLVTLERLLLGPFRGVRLRLHATVVQAVRSGVDSLPLVGLIQLLVGMIIALQAAYQLEKLGAANMVANLVGITVTRELAPLLTGIIVAGRFGSRIAAELGTMRVSQEVDALTVMGIDPIPFLVVPRVLGLIIALPCLTVFADVAGIAGGMVVGVLALGLGPTGFLLDALDALALEDIFTGLVKAVAFAALIGLVGCQRGLATRGGAEEVGQSTTSSVVRSIALIIAADLVVTALFYLKD